jgi:hypothetical protein
MSRTSPVIPGLGCKQPKLEGTSSRQESHKNSAGSSEGCPAISGGVSVTAHDLDDLLSKAKAAADANVKNQRTYCNSSVWKLQQPSNPNALHKSRTLSQELFGRLENQKVNINLGDVKPAKTRTNMQAGNGGSSETPEGDIREDSKLRKTILPSGPKQFQVTAKNVAELGLYKSRDEVRPG